MNVPWKSIAVLAVALPAVAYVAGTLVASAEEPRDRAPIVVEQPDDRASVTPDGEGTAGPSKGGTPDGKATNKPAKPSKNAKPDLEVVRPTPDDLDDDDDDRGERDDDDGDDRGERDDDD